MRTSGDQFATLAIECLRECGEVEMKLGRAMFVIIRQSLEIT
jgi:hypothetical protein